MRISPSPFKQGLCEDPDQDYRGLWIPLGSYLELGWSKNLASASSSLTSILFGKACQVPDCTEKRDAFTQCDSQERFHRSQVFGGASQNRAMQTRPAIFPLHGGGLPSRSPRSHGDVAPLDDSPVKRDSLRYIIGIHIFLKNNFPSLLYLVSQQIQGNWGLAWLGR